MKSLNNMLLGALTLCAKLVLVVGLSVSFNAEATQLKKQNLTQLINESQSIIYGTVKSVTDGIADNGIPYTEVTIVVADSAKGNIKDKAEYTFRQFGLLKPREMSNGKQLLAVSPDGFPQWRQDETVMAFLYKPATRTGLQTTVGLAQGKLHLNNGKLVNQFNNLGLFENVEIEESLLSAEEASMLTLEGAVDAETLMGLVGRAVSGDWIEKGEMK